MDAKTPAAEATPRQPGELSPGAVKGLKIAIVVMGIMIVAGILAIIGRIVYLAGNKSQPAPVPIRATADGRVTLPPGATIRTIALDANRLAIHHDGPAGPGIVVVDVATGQPVGRIVIAPEAPRP